VYLLTGKKKHLLSFRSKRRADAKTLNSHWQGKTNQNRSDKFEEAKDRILVKLQILRYSQKMQARRERKLAETSSAALVSRPF